MIETYLVEELSDVPLLRLWVQTPNEQLGVRLVAPLLPRRGVGDFNTHWVPVVRLEVVEYKCTLRRCLKN